MATVLVPSYLKGRYDQAPPGHRFQFGLGGWTRGDGGYKCEKRLAIPPVLEFRPAALALLERLRQRQQSLSRQLPPAALLHVPAATTAPLVTGVGIEHPTENGFSFLSPYGLPYLPGSGVKGVLRRAAEDLAGSGEQGWDWMAVWRLFGFENMDAFELPIADEAAARAEAARLRELDPCLAEGLCKTRGSRRSSADETGAKGREIPKGGPPPGNEVARPSRAGAAGPPALPRASGSLGAAERGPAPSKGFEGDFYELLTEHGTKHRRGTQWRGALAFWDVLLAPPDGKMCMEVLTPHHKSYYEDKAPPADCESPTPVPFLAVPAGTKLDLYVECEMSRLAERLRQSWRPMMQAAARHAFERLGFGAKTAVGYGALREEAERAAAGVAPATRPAPARVDGPGDQAARLIQELEALGGAERCARARAVKAEMQRLGEWDPADTKKKGRRTQRVMAILAECGGE